MQKNSLLIGFLLIGNLMFSCSKEDGIIVPETGTEEKAAEEKEVAEEKVICRVTKIFNNSYNIKNFEYNSDGKAEKIIYTDAEGKLEDYAVYTYNQQGNVEKINYHSADGLSTRYTEVKYNAEELVSETGSYRETENGKELYNSKTYKYDDKNRLVRVDETDNSSSDVQLYYTFDKFDEAGNFLIASFYDYINGVAELRSVHEYIYDDKPNVYSGLKGFAYGYDVFTATPNNAIEIIADNKDGVQTGEGLRRSFEYNEHGYPTLKSEEYDDSPGKVHKTYQEYSCQ